MLNPITRAKAAVETKVKTGVKDHFVQHRTTYQIAAGALGAGVVGTLLLRGASTTVNVHVHVTQEES